MPKKATAGDQNINRNSHEGSHKIGLFICQLLPLPHQLTADAP